MGPAQLGDEVEAARRHVHLKPQLGESGARCQPLPTARTASAVGERKVAGSEERGSRSRARSICEKGGSEHVRLVGACRCSGSGAALGQRHARRYSQRAEQGGGRGGRARGRGEKVAHLRGTERTATKLAAAAFGALGAASARARHTHARWPWCTAFPTPSDHKLNGGMPLFRPTSGDAESHVSRAPAAAAAKTAGWAGLGGFVGHSVPAQHGSSDHDALVGGGRRLIHDGALWAF